MCEVFYLNKTVAVTRDRAVDSRGCYTWCSPSIPAREKTLVHLSNSEMLINAFMTSRLDYCNALLGGCSARLINELQMV